MQINNFRIFLIVKKKDGTTNQTNYQTTPKMNVIRRILTFCHLIRLIIRFKSVLKLYLLARLTSLYTRTHRCRTFREYS